MFDQILFSQNGKLVQYCIDFFTSKVRNPSLYKKIIKVCKENEATYFNDGKKTYLDANYRMKLQLNYLSITNFQTFYSKEGKGKGIPMLVIEKTLERLCNIGICSPVYLFQDNKKYDIPYAPHEDYISFLHKNSALDNLFYNFTYIVKKYKSSIYKIVVEVKKYPSIGTGFLIKLKNKHVLLTNKHVAEYKEGLLVENEKGENIEYSKVVLSDTHDLAMIILKELQMNEGFNFLSEYDLLDEVVTIGYPKVAMTRDSYQLAHKGEINARVEDYSKSENIIFSAKTSPGNSGGPLINKYGLVVGVVTKELLCEEISSSYFAAIPSSDVISFINKNI